MIEDLKDIMNNGEISDEMKDIVEDYKGKLEDALQKAEGETDPETGEQITPPDMPGAKEDVENATNEFNKDLSDFMEDHFGAQEMGKDMIGNLDQAQDNLNGDKSENQEGENQEGENQQGGDKQEQEGDSQQGGDKEQEGQNPEGDKQEQEGEQGKGESESDKENESDSESEGDSENESDSENTGGGGNSEYKDEATIFIPGFGNMTFQDLVDQGVLNDEFDKMFDRELTEEERQFIANYLDTVKK